MPNEQEQSGEVRVNRGRIGSISVYDVTEDELNQLEQGSPSSIYLNFAIGLLSIGVSFLIALLLTKIESIYLFTVFVLITLATIIAGAILLVLWWRASKTTTNIVKRIKERMITPPQTQVPQEETS